MATPTKISFKPPTTNTDGTPITLALTYVAFIDKVDPPVKSYPVPAIPVAADGTITATFAQLGFVPVDNVKYFAFVEAVDSAGTSAPSAEVQFIYSVPPNPPTAPVVS